MAARTSSRLASVTAQQVVDDHDPPRAFAQQAAHDGGADEARPSGDNVMAHDGNLAIGFPGSAETRRPGVRRRAKSRKLRAKSSRYRRGGARSRTRAGNRNAGAAVTAVDFIHVDVADEVEIALDQHGVRLGFVHRVVDIEHGSDRRAVDFVDDFHGFGQRLHHVALADGQRFHQHGDAARLAAAAPRGEPVAMRRVASSRVMPPVVARCLGEPKTMTPSGPRSAQRSMRSRMWSQPRRRRPASGVVT